MLDPIRDVSQGASSHSRLDQGQINYLTLVYKHQPDDVKQLGIAYYNYQQNPDSQKTQDALGQAIITIIQDVAYVVFSNPQLKVKDDVDACIRLLNDPNIQETDVVEVAAIACGLARIIQVPREGYSAESKEEAGKVSDTAIGLLKGVTTPAELSRTLEQLKMTL